MTRFATCLFRFALCACALAAFPASAERPDSATNDTAFFHAALAFARTEAERAGMRCHTGTFTCTHSIPSSHPGASLSFQLDVTSPETPQKTFSATLWIGHSGTNGFQLADFDHNVALRERSVKIERLPDGSTDYTSAMGMTVRVSPPSPRDPPPDRVLHATADDRFLVLKIPGRCDAPGRWDPFWTSATNAFIRQNGRLSGENGGRESDKDDLEIWGLDWCPRFASRAAEIGLERVDHCSFDSKEPFHNGLSFLTYRWPLDQSGKPGWRLWLSARSADDKHRPLRATLFAGRGTGLPFRPQDWLIPNDPRKHNVRHRTDGRHFFVLVAEVPRFDDPVLDRILDEAVAAGRSLDNPGPR
ncbi:MAG: hypothetical protein IJS32_00135 [Kiritimatiellae bacterium]|nr:hypothetical protein [Kiritimatiellia bacterium]